MGEDFEARQEFFHLHHIIGEGFGGGVDGGQAAADDHQRQAQLHVGDRVGLGRAGELQRHEEIRGRAHASRETVGDIEHGGFARAHAQGQVVEAEFGHILHGQGAAKAHPAEQRKLLAPLEQQADDLEEILVPTHGDAVFGDAAETRHDPIGEPFVDVAHLAYRAKRHALAGSPDSGERVPFRPIREVRDLYEGLSDRVMAGFGGVAEYGITVRWDKNFLKIIRLLLERREQFALFGGVRFGGTLTVEDVAELGFDHLALCMGAGKPTVLDIPNGLARGVRAASDFLMALQLTGAAKADSIANMQLRLPVVVIGGGLTAVDTATESLAYYVVQVEKFLTRFEILAAEIGEDAV